MDNPSCPRCGHYNAMLGVEETRDEVVRECRDCGHVTRTPTARQEDDGEWSCPVCDAVAGCSPAAGCVLERNAQARWEEDEDLRRHGLPGL